MSDLATMPVRELIAAVREKVADMEPLYALVFSVLINRLEQEADRADALEQRLKNEIENFTDF